MNQIKENHHCPGLSIREPSSVIFFGVRTLKVSKCFQTPKMVTWHHALTADTLKCLYQPSWHLSPQKCKESLEARSDRLSKKFETKHCNRWNIREPSLQPIAVERKAKKQSLIVRGGNLKPNNVCSLQTGIGQVSFVQMALHDNL